MKEYFSKFSTLITYGKRSELVVTCDENYCDDRYAFVAGREKLKRKAVFRQHMGSRTYDYIDTTYAVLELISDKFLDVLEDNNFTGWDTYPVEILDKKGNEIKGYHGLIVPGRCGPILHHKAEEIIIDSPIGKKMKAWKGLYFDPATHDGSDFVVPEGTGFKIVKESVVEALKKAKITNIHFDKLTDFIRTWEV